MSRFTRDRGRLAAVKLLDARDSFHRVIAAGLGYLAEFAAAEIELGRMDCGLLRLAGCFDAEWAQVVTCSANE